MKCSGLWGHTVGLGRSFLPHPVHVTSWFKVPSHSPRLPAFGERISSPSPAPSPLDLTPAQAAGSPPLKSEQQPPSAPQIHTNKPLLFPTPASPSGLATSISGLSPCGSVSTAPHIPFTELCFFRLSLFQTTAQLGFATPHTYTAPQKHCTGTLHLLCPSVCSLAHVHHTPRRPGMCGQAPTNGILSNPRGEGPMKSRMA